MRYISNIQTITEYINIMFNCYNSFNLPNNYSQIWQIIIKLYKRQKPNHISLLKYTCIIKFKNNFIQKVQFSSGKLYIALTLHYQRHLVSVMCVSV